MTHLAELADALALAVTAAALVAGGVALAVGRRVSVALPVLLELLVAAGLLRLAGDPDWRALATAAVIVALRHLIGYGLRLSRSAEGPPHRRPRAPGRRRPAFPPLRDLLRPAWRA